VPSWEDTPDYYATFFEDADGIRLEVMNFREIKRKVMYDWEARPGTTPNATPDLAAGSGVARWLACIPLVRDRLPVLEYG
jgi:hypothetical protein